ncbi:transcriptional regulator [Puniceibacterium antarcticum]|uniref:Transcriptional regulator n=1 Tax=Puniceibacterium antarcticum TaxID=1206336 RepID=A0A2G8RG97_9RHOB|nr:transcriptional regulator [Puniceibacterium antarcticum]
MIRVNAGDLDREVAAARLGIGKSTIAHYERGDRTPDAEVLRSYSKVFGIDLNWLICGESLAQRSVKDADEFIRIPRYDVAASAGPGVAPDSETLSGVIAFDQAFLRSLGTEPDKCSAISVRGDSMEPTISDGAVIIIDHSQATIKDGGIYVLNVGDDLLMKRIRRRLDGSIELVSDNILCPTETISADSVTQLRVIGRVVYFCREP